MKKLSNKTMSEVQGGVSLAEYCGTVAMIIENNPTTPAMLAAWGTHCTTINKEQ